MFRDSTIRWICTQMRNFFVVLAFLATNYLPSSTKRKIRENPQGIPIKRANLDVGLDVDLVRQMETPVSSMKVVHRRSSRLLKRFL